VLVARVSNKSICIPITLRENKKDRKPVELEALLDSGAGGLFIDETFAKQNEFTLNDLSEHLNAYNVDGTLNKKGTVTSYVKADLHINERIRPIQLYVTGLGRQKVILGFPWLRDENPDINWTTGEICWKNDKRQERRKLETKAIELTRARLNKMIPIIEKQTYPSPTAEDAEEQEEDQTCYPIPDWYPSDAVFITAKEQAAFKEYAQKLMANPTSRIHKSMKRMAAQVDHTEIDIDADIDIEHINFDLSQESDDQALIISYLQGKATEELEDVWINSTMSHSQAFAEKYEGNVQDEQIDLKEAVPPELHEYLNVFSDEKASRFPKSTPWDHKIELKEGFQPKSFKIYPMTPEEDTMTKNLLTTTLKKVLFAHLNPQWQPHSFSYIKRGQQRNDLVKTTDTWITGWSKTLIHYPLFPTSWIKSKTQNTSPKWTSV
jgi:hypothetical protein